MLAKDLGAIPTSFSVRNKYTLNELDNFLNSKCHPFEKMETLANGLLLQMLRMMYLAASTQSNSNCWLIDVNCKGYENTEVKKAAISAFSNKRSNGYGSSSNIRTFMPKLWSLRKTATLGTRTRAWRNSASQSVFVR